MMLVNKLHLLGPDGLCTICRRRMPRIGPDAVGRYIGVATLSESEPPDQGNAWITGFLDDIPRCDGMSVVEIKRSLK